MRRNSGDVGGEHCVSVRIHSTPLDYTLEIGNFTHIAQILTINTKAFPTISLTQKLPNGFDFSHPESRITKKYLKL